MKTSRRLAPRRAALPLLLLAAAPPSLLAQQNPVATLASTVVSATRTSQPFADVLADVSIIDRQTIENSGARGIADLLARVPGVEFTRNGGPGTVTSVFLRGAESRHTAVYIDGARVDSQATGGALWESIPLAQIDRIEVLRGSAAAVYGSDAIGGVVQIFTKNGEGPPAPYLSFGVGSHRTTRVEAGVSGATDRVDYALDVAQQRSDGFNSRPLPAANPDDDGYRQTSASGRLGVRPAAGQRLEATFLASRMNSQYDGFLPGQDDRSHHRLRTLGLSWSADWTSGHRTRLSVTDTRSRYETTPSPYLTETALRGYYLQNEWRIERHTLTAALERREDRLENEPIDKRRADNALALGYGYTGERHTLQLNARRDRDSEFGGQTTGGAAYGYAITKQWRASVAASTSFRAPTLYQRFSEYGVENLEPETGRNVEVGLRWVDGASNAGLVAYRNRLRNLIGFAGAGGCASPFGCYANTGRAELEGVTLSGEHRLVPALSLRGSVDFQNPRDQDSGKLLARRARRHAAAGADLRVAGWTLGAESQLSGARFDNAANTVQLGGYTLFNLYASRRLARDWTLLARVDNLANKDYQLASGYATPGRFFWLGVKWAPVF